jgi:hypothetical protein
MAYARRSRRPDVKRYSMRIELLRVILSLAASAAALYAHAAENGLSPGPHIVHIEAVAGVSGPSLCLLDGQLGFLVQQDPRRTNPDLAVVSADTRKTSTTTYPHESISTSFLIDGSSVRVLVSSDQRVHSKVQSEQANWYLTADYTTTPPRVILTKEPSKSSRWRFIDAKFSGDAFLSFIWNENDQGKGGWLAFGKVIKAYGDGTLREPILSSDEKKRFQLDGRSK